MLTLTRKCHEIVVVGASNRFERLLKVTALKIENGRVRLGFEAIDDAPITRFEEWEQSKRVRKNGRALPLSQKKRDLQLKRRRPPVDETPHQDQLKRIAAASAGRELILAPDVIEELEKELANETSHRAELELIAAASGEHDRKSDVTTNQMIVISSTKSPA